MKIRPYRVCDICGEQYSRRLGALNVKRYSKLHDGMIRFDVCPKCGQTMISWIRYKRGNNEQHNIDR